MGDARDILPVPVRACEVAAQEAEDGDTLRRRLRVAFCGFLGCGYAAAGGSSYRLRRVRQTRASECSSRVTLHWW